ncbi:MAG: hypothetical protein U5K69_16920 [Balneolaceae bacterium]|nr:hypothetical protein [Balneolaceae bacterium]
MNYVKHEKSRINFDLVNEYVPKGENRILFLGFSGNKELTSIKSWEFENKDMRDKALKKLDKLTGCADINSDKRSPQTGFV